MRLLQLISILCCFRAAAKRYARVYQAGTQQRSEYGAKFRIACEFVRSGRIGKLKEIYAYRDWVLDPVAYSSIYELVSAFDGAVIEPANKRMEMLQSRKAAPLSIRHAKDYQRDA